jgi:hypothetical protein
LLFDPVLADVLSNLGLAGGKAAALWLGTDTGTLITGEGGVEAAPLTAAFNSLANSPAVCGRSSGRFANARNTVASTGRAAMRAKSLFVYRGSAIWTKHNNTFFPNNKWLNR